MTPEKTPKEVNNGKMPVAPVNAVAPVSGVNVVNGVSGVNGMGKSPTAVPPLANGYHHPLNGYPPAKRNRRAADGWGVVKPSLHSQNTINPIRRIVDVMQVKPNPDKPLISLHIGDPTITGILNTHPNIVQAVQDSLLSGKFNGYGPAIGFPEVRKALAESVTSPEAPVTADDVVLTSGCSHALQLAIEALANPGDNILIPKPGFSIYGTLMKPHGIEERFYNLLSHRNWEADLGHLESLIDDKTAAIIVNNPSNPCGAVYSKEHLEQILQIADKYKVPIIADEIYGNMIYDGAQFHPLATLEPKVPVLSCDGISKRYLVPGWRLGWVIAHDHHGALAQIKVAMRQLAQKIVGPGAIIQGALPAILKNTPPEFFQRTCEILGNNAKVVLEELRGAPGLTPIPTQGAMYMMVVVEMQAFPEFHTELELIQALIGEESVYCLPGTAFNYPSAVRLVITWPEEKIRTACRRIKEFCYRHYRPSPTTVPSALESGLNGVKEE